VTNKQAFLEPPLISYILCRSDHTVPVELAILELSFVLLSVGKSLNTMTMRIVILDTAFVP
jgi:hypothetical protein